MKYLFLDVETTGIDPTVCAIIQLSCIIEIDGMIKETLNYKIKPHPGATIQPEALSVSNTTLQDLDSYTPPYIVFQEFIQVLEKYVHPFNKKDKLFFLAYNAPFDSEFVRQFFIRNGSNYYSSYFWTPSLDVMVLALEHLKGKRSQLANFRLMTVAKTLGIEINESKLHDALYDIMVTRDLYYKIVQQEALKAPQETIVQEKVTSNPTKSAPHMENKEFFDGLF